MATAIRYLRGGNVVAETSVEGHLLPLSLPRVVTATYRTGAIDLVEDPDPLLECCGRLTLVAVDDSNEFRVDFLAVPPPPPFTEQELREMWEARNRLTSARRTPSSGEADWSETTLHPSLRVRLERLPSAIASAQALLARWPTRAATRQEMLPIGRRGGREDLLATARIGTRAGVAVHGGAQLPARTVRTFGELKRRRCESVSTIAELLRDRADDVLAGPLGLPDVSARRAALGPLGAVAESASMPLGAVDGPPSTWPSLMQAFYSLAATALTEIEIVGAGDNTSPLSELWELYQAWVAEQVFAHVCGHLGPPAGASTQSSLLGRWKEPGLQIELHYTPTIPAQMGKSREICGSPLNANIGDLQPDLVLAARRTDGGVVRLLIVDPKKRPFLDPGTVAVEASKYLWGIEGALLDGVVLVAPSGGASSARRSGNAWTLAARPTLPLLADAVRNWIDLVAR